MAETYSVQDGKLVITQTAEQVIYKTLADLNQEKANYTQQKEIQDNFYDTQIERIDALIAKADELGVMQ